MKYLIRSARITDPRSPLNGKKMDLLIEGGEIVQLRSHIHTDEKVKVIQTENLFVSPGWLDMQANFCDPGHEVKEDIASGLKAAAAGGFTGVCLSPATQPPVSSKSQIEYVLSKARGNAVEVYPMGTATHQLAGDDLSEMYDMKLAGAVAFSDDKKPLENAGLLMRCLQYSSNIDSLLITHCDERSLSKGGLMNEGAQSTAMGVKGIPAIAEELMLERNLSILRNTGGRLHIPFVSTKRSVELIKNAKAQGLAVTAGVAAINLLMDDSSLEGFDSNLKLNPPLRSREDVEALRKAVNAGVIDVVVSDHLPEDVENKELEFDYAAFGAIGLETTYGCLQTAIKKIDPEQLANCLSIRPRAILGLPPVEIKEGAKANLTLFDPTAEWIFEKRHIQSKSRNTALVGHTFMGKVIGIINKNQFIAVH